MGGATLEVCYEVCSPRAAGGGTSAGPQTVYAKAASGIVLVDAATMRPRRRSEREREIWSPYLDEPVQFSRR